MCTNPLMAALAVGQTGLGLAQASTESRRQKREAARRSEEVRAKAIADYGRVQSEREAERATASRRLEESRRDALKARARVQTAHGEAGGGGGSATAATRDLAAREARFAEDLRVSDSVADAAARRELAAIERGVSASYARIPTPQRPDYVGRALDLSRTIGGMFLKAR